MSNFAGPNLNNGIATLSVRLPEDVVIGSKLEFLARSPIPIAPEPFENRFMVLVKPEAQPNGGGGLAENRQVKRMAKAESKPPELLAEYHRSDRGRVAEARIRQFTPLERSRMLVMGSKTGLMGKMSHSTISSSTSITSISRRR